MGFSEGMRAYKQAPGISHMRHNKFQTFGALRRMEIAICFVGGGELVTQGQKKKLSTCLLVACDRVSGKRRTEIA
jgi:hypothetical protein